MPGKVARRSPRWRWCPPPPYPVENESEPISRRAGFASVRWPKRESDPACAIHSSTDVGPCSTLPGMLPRAIPNLLPPEPPISGIATGLIETNNAAPRRHRYGLGAIMHAEFLEYAFQMALRR